MFQSFGRELFARSVKTTFYASRRKKKKKLHFFWKKIKIISSLFVHWAKRWQFFRKTFSARLKKLHTTCPEKLFQKFSFLRRLFGLWSIYFWVFWPINLRQRCEIAFFLSRMGFGDEFFLINQYSFFIIIFGICEKQFRIFDQKYCQGCQNCISRDQKNSFEDKFLSRKKSFSIPFKNLSENFF